MASMCCQSPAVNWSQGQNGTVSEDGQFILSCTGCGTIWEPAQPRPQEHPSDNSHLEARIAQLEQAMFGPAGQSGAGDWSNEQDKAQSYRKVWEGFSKMIDTTTPTTWSRSRLNIAMRKIGVEHGIYPPSVAESPDDGGGLVA